MELWSIQHIRTLIPAIIFMIAVSVALRIILKDKSHKIRMIPFQVLSLVIVLLEIGKQTVSVSRGYDLYHLPFHFCSLFIFMLPLAAFYKGKYKEKVFAVTSAICAAVFFIMLGYPSLIYSAGDIDRYFEDFLCFHTVTFHNIVMLEFLLIVFLDLHVPRKTDTKPIIIFIVCFNVIAATMAQLLKTNYNNLYTCNIPPLEALRQSVENALGAVPAKLLYIVIVIIMDVLFVLMSYGLCKLLKKALSGKTKKAERKELFSAAK